MHEAPFFVDARMVDEPPHRPSARPSNAVLDLFDLLGGVDVDGSVPGQGYQFGKFAWAHGAKAVRGNADRFVSFALHHPATIVDETSERRDVVDEPSLLRFGRRAAERRMGVKHGKQRDPDAGPSGGGENAPGHFRTRLIGRTIGRVVEVVEFGDGGEPRLQHFHIELRRDRLDVVGRHLKREAVHRLAPGPERVDLPAANFRQTGHGPLEGVAMQVRGRRRHDRMTLVALPRLGAGLDGCDFALFDRDPHVGLPALGGQRPCGVKDRQRSAPLSAIGLAGARRLPLGPLGLCNK